MQARFELIKVVAYVKGNERFPKDLMEFKSLKDAIAYCRSASANPIYARVVVSCFDNFWDEFIDIEPKDFEYYLSKKEWDPWKPYTS